MGPFLSGKKVSTVTTPELKVVAYIRLYFLFDLQLWHSGLCKAWLNTHNPIWILQSLSIHPIYPSISCVFQHRGFQTLIGWQSNEVFTPYYIELTKYQMVRLTLLEQGCFTSHLLSFDNNKVLKIINWIC